jgi:hypothetical protein
MKRTSKNKSDSADFWKGIQGIFTIVITNKAFSEKTMKHSYPGEKRMEPLLVNPYQLRHTKQLDRHYGDIPNSIILLMLDNLNKPATALSTSIEDWAYIFKERALRSGSEKIPETKEIEDAELIAQKNPGIREFIERVDVDNLPNEVWERSMRAINDYNGAVLDIENKAEQRGIRFCALGMKKLGISNEQIAVASGLSPAEVDGLFEDDEDS